MTTDSFFSDNIIPDKPRKLQRNVLTAVQLNVVHDEDEKKISKLKMMITTQLHNQMYLIATTL